MVCTSDIQASLCRMLGEQVGVGVRVKMLILITEVNPDIATDVIVGITSLTEDILGLSKTHHHHQYHHNHYEASINKSSVI